MIVDETRSKFPFVIELVLLVWSYFPVVTGRNVSIFLHNSSDQLWPLGRSVELPTSVFRATVPILHQVLSITDFLGFISSFSPTLL